jgi:hypothetical protein
MRNALVLVLPLLLLGMSGGTRAVLAGNAVDV